MSLLRIDNISISFGGIKALSGVNMEVQPGEIRGLIGPNGSGKSTLLNIISRIYNPNSGSISFHGENLLKFKAHHLPRKGVGRSFQNLQLFNNMTALQNLMVPQTHYQDYNIFSAAFLTGRSRKRERESFSRAMEGLRLVGLEHYYKRKAHDLSFGQQKLLELARTLVFKPRLILLDEPAVGLSPKMVRQFTDIIYECRRQYDLAVIIVEHMTKLVMEIADRVTVLNHGRVLAEGTPEEIQRDRVVIDAYLGRGIKEAMLEGLEEPQREVISVGAYQAQKLEDDYGESAKPVGMPLSLGDDGVDGFKGLKVQGVDAYYGKLQVLRNISLRVPRGGVIALLGGNGSGKSTAINAVSGLVKVKGGIIEYNGVRLPRKQPHKVVKMGIVQVPQHREVFPYLNVKENLAMGAYRRRDGKEIEEDYQRVYSYFPRLKERRKQLAGRMSGGEQQMLAIGRALMSGPDLLLLDEPSASLAPTLVEEIFEKLVEINRNGTTLFVVEQNVDLTLKIAQYVYILRQGEIVLEDWAYNLKDNDRIIASYFGTAKK